MLGRDLIGGELGGGGGFLVFVVRERRARPNCPWRSRWRAAAPPTGAASLFTWRNAFGGGVLAFALLGFVGTGWILFGGGLRNIEPPTSMAQSVAVMPFVNVSGDPDNEYFSDGITDELIAALGRLPGVRVPGRTSQFAFKGQSITIQQFADTLGVAHVLEGNVRRDGDRVLITVTLLDALTDSLTELLPAAEGDIDGPATGTVFKIERYRYYYGAVRRHDPGSQRGLFANGGLYAR